MDKRHILAILLGIIILSMCGYIFVNYDDLFTTKHVIDYPDGCQEVYINGELTTEKCAEPIQNDFDIQIDPKFNMNPGLE